jgi:hypothetical protein
MSTGLKSAAVEMQGSSERSGAEKRLTEIGIKLSAPPEPVGTYCSPTPLRKFALQGGTSLAYARNGQDTAPRR